MIDNGIDRLYSLSILLTKGSNVHAIINNAKCKTR